MEGEQKLDMTQFLSSNNSQSGGMHLIRQCNILIPGKIFQTPVPSMSVTRVQRPVIYSFEIIEFRKKSYEVLP